MKTLLKFVDIACKIAVNRFYIHIECDFFLKCKPHQRIDQLENNKNGLNFVKCELSTSVYINPVSQTWQYFGFYDAYITRYNLNRKQAVTRTT